MNETWRSIPGFPGYEASDQGRVRSVDRMIMTKQGWRRRQGQVLKPKFHDGYWRVGISAVHRKVHVFVAAAFHGARPEGLVTRHLDGDNLNNRPSNLVYGTPKQNTADMLRHGNHMNARKIKCMRGHELTGVNLRLTINGGRACRACGWTWGKYAQSIKHGDPQPFDFQRVADARFVQIMG